MVECSARPKGGALGPSHISATSSVNFQFFRLMEIQLTCEKNNSIANHSFITHYYASTDRIEFVTTAVASTL